MRKGFMRKFLNDKLLHQDEDRMTLLTGKIGYVQKMRRGGLRFSVKTGHYDTDWVILTLFHKKKREELLRTWTSIGNVVFEEGEKPKVAQHTLFASVLVVENEQSDQGAPLIPLLLDMQGGA